MRRNLSHNLVLTVYNTGIWSLFRYLEQVLAYSMLLVCGVRAPGLLKVHLVADPSRRLPSHGKRCGSQEIERVLRA